MSSHIFSMRLDEDTIERLLDIATARGETLSVLIRDIIDNYLSTESEETLIRTIESKKAEVTHLEKKLEDVRQRNTIIQRNTEDAKRVLQRNTNNIIHCNTENVLQRNTENVLQCNTERNPLLRSLTRCATGASPKYRELTKKKIDEAYSKNISKAEIIDALNSTLAIAYRDSKPYVQEAIDYADTKPEAV